jgi:hypothetical protein
VAWVCKRTIPSNRCLSAKLVPTFVDRGVLHNQRGGSPTAIISVSRLEPQFFFFQVAPQLYTQGWVDPVTKERMQFGHQHNKCVGWDCWWNMCPKFVHFFQLHSVCNMQLHWYNCLRTLIGFSFPGKTEVLYCS